MNKRLRKKLHKGEFKELGFECDIKLSDTSEATVDRFIDHLVDFLTAQGLVVGGKGSDDWTLVISKQGGGSTSSAERQASLEWLTAQPEIAEVRVSQLFDIWYPPKSIPYQA